MKKNVIALVALLSIGLGNVWAEGASTNEVSGTNESAVRTVKSPRFARSLVEKWIEEYAKVEPGVRFEIAKGGSHEADLNVVIAGRENGEGGISHTIYFAESAVLPITARGSEADEALNGKRLNTKKLKQLYFLNDDLEEDVKKNKTFERLVVYSGGNATSAAQAFAHNFGEEQTNFRGKRISGDDLFLNTALDKDPLGVSFNLLPNIFDLKSRQLKSDLSLIGIDVKKDLEPTFSNHVTLDQLILVLENGKPQQVATQKVGISYNAADDAIGRFLGWVLSEGTKYNHQYGLLNLDKKETSTEIEKVRTVLTAQK